MSYSLIHGPTRRSEAPYTFELPHSEFIDALGPGDHAKLGFEYDSPDGEFGGERMWVLIDEVDGDRFSGTLDNMPAEDVLSCGDRVEFSRDHILDFRYAEGKARPFVSPRPDYFRRCMVDACVLYDGVPVEYLYREEPDLGQPDDEHADSGWRIRGRQGDATDEDMEDREAAYVALAAVLNRDDSWLHLIDAPTGSAFTRDFRTGEYQDVS